MSAITWLLAAIHAVTVVPARQLDAIAQVESGWNPDLVSSSGCVGIYQLMPRYAAIERARLRDPLLSRMEAARQLLRWYAASARGHDGRSWFRATAAYNCGWGGLSGKCGTGYAKHVYTVMGSRWRHRAR